MPLPLHPPEARTVAVLLAGGKGTRLHELTRSECKPAIHFAGTRRIVDFAMANAVRSGLTRMVVATQYAPATLTRHLWEHWAMAFDCGEGLMVRHGPSLAGFEGYRGTADAVTRNIALIDSLDPTDILVLAADHIYGMDYTPMLDAHRASGAAVTVAAHIVPRAGASEFGIFLTDATGRATTFLEKPADPPGLPDDPARALASMGIYAFRWDWLRATLLRDARDATSSHDFGHDILPAAVAAGEALVWPFTLPQGPAYWRDVGTLDAFRVTQLDFQQPSTPCALPETVMPGPGPQARPTRNDGLLSDSVLMPGASVGRGARLHRTIVAPDTHIPGGMVIGEDRDEDARWFRRTPDGTVLVTAEMLARREATLPRFRSLVS
ncbi:MAG: ADP-glucose pyrophosphorylase [Rhodobacter sp. CACIA14H1]|nr:MAG: ADP-glucose pyrophosphorylase [Rhodobacter sp. CACIA14H1]